MTIILVPSFKITVDWQKSRVDEKRRDYTLTTWLQQLFVLQGELVKRKMVDNYQFGILAWGVVAFWYQHVCFIFHPSGAHFTSGTFDCRGSLWQLDYRE